MSEKPTPEPSTDGMPGTDYVAPPVVVEDKPLTKVLTVAQAFEQWCSGVPLSAFGPGAEEHFRAEAKQLRAAFECAMDTLHSLSDGFGDQAYDALEGHDGPEWYRHYRMGYGHACAVASNAAGHGFNRVTLKVIK